MSNQIISEKVSKMDNGAPLTNNIFDNPSFPNELSINGCKIILNFLPKSDGKAVDTAKKILITSILEHKDGTDKPA